MLIELCFDVDISSMLRCCNYFRSL